ncbi:uncharacterized protein LOC133029204 [Cannabis sativa]|uniref:GIR1-like zinc ribbon domain-containing protein n=1 Tax=Cannabis sativa TaxID=3483 RepID=A0A7J6E6K7_CANSA|nr:uncharacterized protein LOC133029204 [Cannabis sativa]KAF4354083.1 hypothetical protein F8388_002483 [Cannabis sativa]
MVSPKSLSQVEKDDEAKEVEVVSTEGKDDSNKWVLGLSSTDPKIPHKTIHLDPVLINSSSTLSSDDTHECFINFPIQNQKLFHDDEGYVEKETKEKSFMRNKRTQNEDEDDNIGGIDLDLKLSPPNEHYSSVPKGSQSKSSSSSHQEPNGASKYMCSTNNDQRDSASVASTVEMASLVLMGCTNCLMYVMVSQIEPKCPKCKSSLLLDFFREHPSSAKRPRRS